MGPARFRVDVDWGVSFVSWRVGSEDSIELVVAGHVIAALTLGLVWLGHHQLQPSRFHAGWFVLLAFWLLFTWVTLPTLLNRTEVRISWGALVVREGPVRRRRVWVARSDFKHCYVKPVQIDEDKGGFTTRYEVVVVRQNDRWVTAVDRLEDLEEANFLRDFVTHHLS